MKWFQVDADTPNDPKIRAVQRALGTEGMGGLFLLWCFIADHGTDRPGWSIDSSGRPIPVDDLRDASKLEQAKFDELVAICLESGHFERRPWTTRKVIAIPAMASRADTYTRRSVRTSSEQASKKVRRVFGNKTTQHKTVQTKTSQEEKAAAPPRPSQDLSAPSENVGVITKLAHEAIDALGPQHEDLAETVKSLCATHRVNYDSEVVRKAIDSAVAQRRRPA